MLRENYVFLLVTSVRHDEMICSYQTLLNKSNFKTDVQGFFSFKCLIAQGLKFLFLFY